MTSRLTHQGLGNELLVYTSLDIPGHSSSGKFSSGEVIVKEAKYTHTSHNTGYTQHYKVITGFWTIIQHTQCIPHNNTNTFT